jgi:phosphotransferase system enzyme I (PtsP)
LLDYDRNKLRGLLVEEASGQSHVAIVAKALGIPAIGQAEDVIERVANGDAVILDAESGEVHLRPSADVIAAYSDKVRFRARRQSRYAALRNRPAVTKDGQHVALHINAGLQVDLPHLEESGADGIGLFRTELQFMLSETFPRLEKQIEAYRNVMDVAGERPVVFRSLDIGGDKVLPYMRQPHEENPALGWRAIRMSLDRPALFRTQVRALLRAADGRELRLMLPMVACAEEIDAARALIAKELAIHDARGNRAPKRLLVGAMIEVPSVLFDVDAILRRVDFASVGSNDLMQLLFAADRNNGRVAKRFDPLSVPALRALKAIVAAARRRKTPLNLCGELAGRPVEAMALIGLGYRSISMAPASIGPVKAMILSVDAGRLKELVEEFIESGSGSVRGALQRYAEADGAEL